MAVTGVMEEMAETGRKVVEEVVLEVEDRVEMEVVEKMVKRDN